MRPLRALAAVLTMSALGASVAQAQYRRCNHNQVLGANIHLGADMELAWSDAGDGAPDSANWGDDPISMRVLNRASRAYWDLDHDNPRVFMGTAHTDHGFNADGPDLVSLIHKHAEIPGDVMGRTATVAFFDLITEVDIEIRGSTTDHTPAEPLPVAERCAHNRTTLGGVAVHELGHAYGYAHWFDWISMMNPGHADALSCERNSLSGRMVLTPDALTTQCHDIQYGLAAGVDFSGTPVRQTCVLASGACASAMSTLTRYAPGATFSIVLAQLTTFSNRDTHPGGVAYRLLVSLDTRADDVDREVGRGTLTNWSAGATVTRTLGGRMNPSTDLPLLGREYMLLMELDPDHLVAETDETNNVIDTLIRFVRE
jgi:hypothetical protein